MNIHIQLIEAATYEQVHAFQSEYLDQESLGDFVQRVKENPDLYLVAFDQDQLVGICYGHPETRIPNTIALQGIAVNLDTSKDYARKGIGSHLLKEFEQIVKRKGYASIALGSAEDEKVEAFYVKNGFRAIELLAHGPDYQKRLPIKDYPSGKIKQKELRKNSQLEEIIFILRKNSLKMSAFL